MLRLQIRFQESTPVHFVKWMGVFLARIHFILRMIL